MKNEFFLKTLLRPTWHRLKDIKKNIAIFLFELLPQNTIDYLLERTISVKRNGSEVFSIRNMGFITRVRASTFETKEPDTIEWLESFKEDDCLVDIGANVGMYSLYAASRGNKVIALEPQYFNITLLNLNISDNKLMNKIIAYPFSLHDKLTISSLNLLNGSGWGTSNSAFDRETGAHGDSLTYAYKQGSIGLSLDELCSMKDIKPNYIKIDVDGNEYLVLKGSIETLRMNSLVSVLVELAEDHPEYEDVLTLFRNENFSLIKKAPVGRCKNHIFSKN